MYSINPILWYNIPHKQTLNGPARLRIAGAVMTPFREVAMSTDSTSNAPLKRCTKCGNEYPATTQYFYKSPNTNSGLYDACISCRREHGQKYDAAHKEDKKAYGANYRSKNKSKISESNALYREANRDRLRKSGLQYYHANKAKSIERSKKYRQQHPEKTRARSLKWRIENPDKLKAIWQRSRIKHRDKRLAYARAYNPIYRQNNIEALKERNGIYYSANRARHRENSRRWQNNNASKYKALMIAAKQRYRSRKQKLPDVFSSNDWSIALDYFDNRCAVCERPIGLWHTLAADHWIPLSNSDCPGTVPTNIVPLCHGTDGCNNSKGSKLPETWLISTFGLRRAKKILSRIQAYFDSLKETL